MSDVDATGVSLPPHWKRHVTKGGREYFHNSFTGRSIWYRPHDEGPPPRPADWVKPDAAAQMKVQMKPGRYKKDADAIAAAATAAADAKSRKDAKSAAIKSESTNPEQKARHKKGEDRPGRTARLAKIGNDALKSMFGAAPKKTVVQGFNVLAAPGLGDGGGNMTLMTKQTFETVDKCEEAYSEARGIYEDGDKWLEVLREHRTAKTQFTDVAGFEPIPEADTYSPSLGKTAQVDIQNKPWERLSSIFRETRWVSIDIVATEGLKSTKGSICGYLQSTEGPQFLFTHADGDAAVPTAAVGADIVNTAAADFAKKTAHAFIDAASKTSSPPASASQTQQDFTVAFNKFTEKDRERGAYKSCGEMRVERSQTAPATNPDSIMKVWVALKFGRDVHMFEREAGTSGVEPGDIVQGRIGNCYYLCALSILSTHEHLLYDILPDIPKDLHEHPEAIQDSLDDEQTFNHEGVYAVRFWRDGKWRIVVVDDWVPIDSEMSSFIMARPAKGSAEIWCLLAEKAYSKLHGSYAATESGATENALEDLCGGVPFRYAIGPNAAEGKYAKTVPAAKADFWRDLKNWMSESSMVGVSFVNSSGGDVDHKDKDGAINATTGCIGNHAYGVLSAFDVPLTDGTTVQLIHIRNPHGVGGEWDGDWSDSDTVHWSLVSAAEKNRIGMVEADDGAFFMKLDSFWNFWDSLQVCRPLMPTPYIDSKWSCFIINGEWVGDSAKGKSDISKIDQFQLNVKQKQEVVITLALPSSRISEVDEYTDDSIVILPLITKKANASTPSGRAIPIGAGGRTSTFGCELMFRGFKVEGTGTENCPRRSTSIALTLDPGTYNICPTTWGAFESRYYLRVFASEASTTCIPV